MQIHNPQRGEKSSFAISSDRMRGRQYDQRFRVMKPAATEYREALQDAFTLPTAETPIECFDISHIQGADTVASMGVWEDGKMKKKRLS